jgi:hypothetical protein
MTLANTLLERLSEWQPKPGRQELHVADPASGWSATLTADRSDVLGCLVSELTLQRGAAVADLAGWAGRVAGRVSGLMEPLGVVEIDVQQQQAQLRSATPTVRGDKRLYYELLLGGAGTATLRRFQAATTAARREQTAYALTHEALAKLVDDVTASA